MKEILYQSSFDNPPAMNRSAQNTTLQEVIQIRDSKDSFKNSAQERILPIHIRKPDLVDGDHEVFLKH